MEGGSLSSFGAQMAEHAGSRAGSPLPQLTFSEPEPAAMNLLADFGNGLLRQAADGDGANADTDTGDDILSTSSSDDEVRCIPKVMQVCCCWLANPNRPLTVFSRSIDCLSVAPKIAPPKQKPQRCS